MEIYSVMIKEKVEGGGNEVHGNENVRFQPLSFRLSLPFRNMSRCGDYMTNFQKKTA
jgi:hypothetical protein